MDNATEVESDTFFASCLPISFRRLFIQYCYDDTLALDIGTFVSKDTASPPVVDRPFHWLRLASVAFYLPQKRFPPVIFKNDDHALYTCGSISHLRLPRSLFHSLSVRLFGMSVSQSVPEKAARVEKRRPYRPE